MIDVLENAGLLVNVCKGAVDPETKKLNLRFTIDQKTGAKLTGMLGKRGMLDRTYYENLDLEGLEKEPGKKIFLFHTTLTELKPRHLEKIESQPLTFLPKNFDYYAGGHIHHKTMVKQEGYGTFTYPGALFPNSFQELERYSYGGYYLIDEEEISWIPIKVIEHLPLTIDCSRQPPELIIFDILNPLNQKDLNNTLLTIRLSGKIEKGKVSDIDFKKIFEQLYRQNAYFVMKNTANLQSAEFEEIKIDSASPEQMEEQLIKEHLQQIRIFDKETEFQLTKTLLQTMNTDKKEGETVKDFQQRVEEELNELLDLKKEMAC